ncbi:hypothetical protein SKAU_G00271600 [Synaphobranchus kaupii]|uniref:Uncharacterized protein n=1 Tax=Synaphobranchus kaupii TaxID=118154 RepID=A0A9Q1IQN5_SYNKA|nr:hypothetical protein SKAU_G00271600 [Synaphobranchus kaupii]
MPYALTSGRLCTPAGGAVTVGGLMGWVGGHATGDCSVCLVAETVEYVLFVCPSYAVERGRWRRELVGDEVARTFSPYQSGTRKRPLTSPTVSQKWKLGKLTSASLGMKRIHFPDKAGTAQEFVAHLLKHFPKLEEGGGFELLRSRGMTRSKDLEVIPCPDGGYTPLYRITEAGIGSATIYVRPLQANLSMDTTTSHTSPGGPTVQCLYCNQLMKQSPIPAHVDVCSRVENGAGHRESSASVQTSAA